MKGNFDSDSVEYLDDDLHVQDRKMNEYSVSSSYLTGNSLLLSMC